MCWRPQNHQKIFDLNALCCRGEGVGGRRIIENRCVSMHVHALFGGVRGVGRPIIIKKMMVSIKISLFVWGGGRPQNHWKYIYRFPYIFMVCLVEWGALAAPESLKMQCFPCILMVCLVRWGARAAPESLKVY